MHLVCICDKLFYMKRVLLIIVFLISPISNAQKIKTILFYKSGDSIEGFSRGVKYDDISFCKEKKGKYKKICITNIDKVILYHKEGKEEYHHIYVKKKKKQKEFFARLIYKGVINHYIYSRNNSFNYTTYNKINIGNGTVINQANQHSVGRNINFFYLKKENDKQAVFMSDVYFSIFGEKVFRKNATKFFNNCSKLVKKIKSKEFKKSDITEIIEFYNSECE